MEKEQTPSILIVEDDLDFRNSTEILFIAEGYYVASASSFEEAVELLQMRTFDVGVVDIRLGGEGAKTGYDVLDFIHNQACLMVCVIITAYGSREADRAEKLIYAKQAYAQLPKPFSPLQFKATLAYALDRHRFLKAVSDLNDISRQMDASVGQLTDCIKANGNHPQKADVSCGGRNSMSTLKTLSDQLKHVVEAMKLAS